MSILQQPSTLSLHVVNSTLADILEKHGDMPVIAAYGEDNQSHYSLWSVEYDNQYEAVKITIDATEPCNLGQINPQNL